MLTHIVGRHSSWAIAAFLFLGSAMGCGDDGGGDNDTPSAGKGGSGTSSGGKGGTGTSSGGSGGSSDVMASDELQGTGDMCHSYTPAEGDKCQGWYCGVTEAQLMAAVNPKAKCGGNVPLLCQGKVTIAVGKCARDEKAADFNASNDVLKERVRDCVYKDEEIKNAVPEDCLDCTLDVAVCAGDIDNCLSACLGGDTPACDACRLEKHCDQPIFACGGLPAPIKVD